MTTKCSTHRPQTRQNLRYPWALIRAKWGLSQHRTRWETLEYESLVEFYWVAFLVFCFFCLFSPSMLLLSRLQ